MESNQFLHEVVVTAIVVKEGKFLITRRSTKKKRFPGMWTVPRGRLETSDYTKLTKDTKFYWYNILEADEDSILIFHEIYWGLPAKIDEEID